MCCWSTPHVFATTYSVSQRKGEGQPSAYKINSRNRAKKEAERDTEGNHHHLLTSRRTYVSHHQEFFVYLPIVVYWGLAKLTTVHTRHLAE